MLALSQADFAREEKQIIKDMSVEVLNLMNAGCYDTYQASAELTEPTWPEYTFHEVLRLCFRNRFIDDTDHPVLKALRGEE